MKIAFLFPGQGAQKVGMGKDFYEKYSEVRDIFNKACDIIGFDIKGIMFDGPETELTETKNAQLATFLVGYAIGDLLKRENITPVYLAGHSLGQYTAVVYSGAISFEDGIKLIKVRGELMSEACKKNPGKMAAIIGLEHDKVEELCRSVKDKIVVTANYNSPSQVVVSGEPDGVSELVELAKNSGVKRAIILAVSGAFHSPLMRDANEQFKELVEKLSINDALIPIVGNTSAEVLTRSDEIKQELKNHMVSSVKWCQGVQKMIDLGVDVFVEVGFGKVLKGVLADIDKSKEVYSTSTVSEFELTLNKIK